ncbi:nitronate monooxygenase [Diaminobutyricimonas aerilata]|uniref:Propionate 3-nitronate monooxygenase n=1 Tax=Diaminobutyricimonas aerilata TaxID=1162967 RepID=A0A2M9CHI3_9MICO|nr:nitronate monooxygenase [Diaminobutyricimonas aerilata]PJJ71315.1 nitronate monooxygenase [Diaminobutyricimonas aerilata]
MNDLTGLVGVDVPIVLGPFGGMSSVALTARVSGLGGLGSFGLYGYSADRIRATVGALREATPRPFAVNLWLGVTEPEPTAEEWERHVEALRPLLEEMGVTPPPMPERFLPTFEEQWEAVLDTAPHVVSFVFGVPSVAAVEEAHRRGIVVIGTATTVDEAVALHDGGVDAVVASGFESAGHRGSFLRPVPESLVGTFALVPQMVDAVPIPVIAAGAVADRRGVAAAFALGAHGVQAGTAFLATQESAVAPGHRRAIAGTPAHGTVLTRAMSGRFARGVPNRAVRSIEERDAIAPFPIQNWLTAHFRAEAARRNEPELLSLWMGQAAALARHEHAHEVFAELVAGLPPERVSPSE